MKITVAFIALFVSGAAFSQVDTEPIKNTDEMSTTIITKTTTKTSNGTDVDIKREVITAKEALALEQDGSTNQSLNRKPLIVTKTTTFISDGEKYKITPDNKGFVITIAKNGNEREYAKLRKLSRPNAYIVVTKQGNAFGYFNAEGDFIVESYDPVKDSILVDNFAINEDSLRQ